MTIHTLSILIPCYNEEGLIAIILSKLVVLKLDNDIKKEIIIVDDASTDNTSAVIKDFITPNNDLNIKFIRHEVNKGKGAAINTVIPKITGEVAIIQGADLEYDPFEYNKLLKPIVDGHADVVYGSRFRGSEAHRVLFFFHTIGNKLITFLSKLFTGLNLNYGRNYREGKRFAGQMACGLYSVFLNTTFSQKNK